MGTNSAPCAQLKAQPPGSLSTLDTRVVPRKLLQDYADFPLENLEDLLQLLLPPGGSVLVTEGVLRQCSEAELILLRGVMRQLVEVGKHSLKGTVEETQMLKTQVQQRRDWAEQAYASMTGAGG